MVQQLLRYLLSADEATQMDEARAQQPPLQPQQGHMFSQQQAQQPQPSNQGQQQQPLPQQAQPAVPQRGGAVVGALQMGGAPGAFSFAPPPHQGLERTAQMWGAQGGPSAPAPAAPADGPVGPGWAVAGQQAQQQQPLPQQAQQQGQIDGQRRLAWEDAPAPARVPEHQQQQRPNMNNAAYGQAPPHPAATSVPGGAARMYGAPDGDGYCGAAGGAWDAVPVSGRPSADDQPVFLNVDKWVPGNMPHHRGGPQAGFGAGAGGAFVAPPQQQQPVQQQYKPQSVQQPQLERRGGGAGPHGDQKPVIRSVDDWIPANMPHHLPGRPSDAVPPTRTSMDNWDGPSAHVPAPTGPTSRQPVNGPQYSNFPTAAPQQQQQYVPGATQVLQRPGGEPYRPNATQVLHQPSEGGWSDSQPDIAGWGAQGPRGAPEQAMPPPRSRDVPTPPQQFLSMQHPDWKAPPPPPQTFAHYANAPAKENKIDPRFAPAPEGIGAGYAGSNAAGVARLSEASSGAVSAKAAANRSSLDVLSKVQQPRSLWQTTNMAAGGVHNASSFRHRG